MANKSNVLKVYKKIDKVARQLIKAYGRVRNNQKEYKKILFSIKVNCFSLSSCFNTLGEYLYGLDVANGCVMRGSSSDYFLYRNLNNLELQAFRTYNMLKLFYQDTKPQVLEDLQHLIEGLVPLISTAAESVMCYLDACNDEVSQSCIDDENEYENGDALNNLHVNKYASAVCCLGCED